MLVLSNNSPFPAQKCGDHSHACTVIIHTDNRGNSREQKRWPWGLSKVGMSGTGIPQFLPLLYYVSQMCFFLQTEGKIFCQQKKKKNYDLLYCDTHFVVVWNQINISPRNAWTLSQTITSPKGGNGCLVTECSLCNLEVWSWEICVCILANSQCIIWSNTICIQKPNLLKN